MAGIARTQQELGEQEPVLSPVVAPVPHAVANVISLQRSAGNQAVAQLLRFKDGGELLELTLRGAALDASDAAHYIRAAKDNKDARKKVDDYRNQLYPRLDEALALVGDAKPPFKGADDLFIALADLVASMQERKLSGHGLIDKKADALAGALAKQGYKRPAAVAKPQAPQDIGNTGQTRAVTLGLAAARDAIESGQLKLAADRKRGVEVTALPGAAEAVTHLGAADQALDDAASLGMDGHRDVLDELLPLGKLVNGVLRSDAKLDGAKALWDAVNRVNKKLGLDPVMPFGTPTATSRAQAAGERLGDLNQRRQTDGRPWTEKDSKEQIAAEHEAIAAANEVAAKGANAGADQVTIADVMARVTEDIGRIESARSAGFTAGVAQLATGALDSPSAVRTFSLALAGNLIWALSSFVPALGLLQEARFLKIALTVKQEANVAAGIGVFGAMLAQFSGGLPSTGTGDVSGRITAISSALDTANSQFCDRQRAEGYIALTKMVDAEPPRPGEDRAGYVAALESTLRYALFGDVFKRGLNSGPRPEYSKVKDEAKRQLLAAVAAPLAGIDEKGKLEQTTSSQDSDPAKKLIDNAQKTGDLKFDPYDLVTSRIPVAAGEMGGQVAFDPEAVVAAIGQGKPIELPVSGWDWKRARISQRAGATGSFTRWSELLRDDRVWTEPKFTLDFALDGESVANITAMTITPADVVKKTYNGKEVFSLERVAFTATGGEHFSGMYRGSKPPTTFKMVYSFAERE
ncbi:hypothetical protein [Solirubrobacter soli]|uniref:hypothetical protein n=1 Tax=Solirubrobacter soli TaxID=363832 RepID=UPI0004298608|nr:hypothetical protein [Solirubrobacter soli]